MDNKFLELSEVLASLDPEYLEHHGIKGQKWGVRRYQNEDGSLTSAGKKRASSRVSKMSDAELQSRTNRLRLENQYRDQKAYANKGRRFLNQASKDLKTTLAISATITSLSILGKKALDNYPWILDTILDVTKKH